MLFIWQTNQGIIAELKKCAPVNPVLNVLVYLGFFLAYEEAGLSKVNKSVFCTIADCRV